MLLALLAVVLRPTPSPAPSVFDDLVTIPGHYIAIGCLKVNAVADQLALPANMPFESDQLREIEQLLPPIYESPDLVLTRPQRRLLYRYASHYFGQAIEKGDANLALFYEEFMDAILATLISFQS